MALNVHESSDVNTLLDYLLGRHRRLTGQIPTADAAQAAAARLADAAYKRLVAGLTGDHVREAWPARRVRDTADRHLSETGGDR